MCIRDSIHTTHTALAGLEARLASQDSEAFMATIEAKVTIN